MWRIFDTNNQNVKKGKTKRDSKLRKLIQFFKLNYPRQKIEFVDDINQYADAIPSRHIPTDETIKLWIPTIIGDCIKNDYAHSLYREDSLAERVRLILISHCYGNTVVTEMRKKEVEYCLKHSTHTPYSYSRGGFNFEYAQKNILRKYLGKNIKPIKISCHKKLKEDLQTLADMNNQTLSEYIRHILIKYYLGYGFLPDFEISKEEIEEITQFMEQDDAEFLIG